MDLGFGEILVVLAIVMLLFGPSKLPGLGKALGEAIRGFKDGMKDGGKPAEPATADEPPLEPKALPPAATRMDAAAVATSEPGRTARS